MTKELVQDILNFYIDSETDLAWTHNENRLAEYAVQLQSENSRLVEERDTAVKLAVEAAKELKKVITTGDIEDLRKVVDMVIEIQKLYGNQPTNPESEEYAKKHLANHVKLSKK